MASRSAVRTCTRSAVLSSRSIPSRSFYTSRSLASSNPGSPTPQQPPQSTHFGYETIPESEKEGRVAGVFTNVAETYDKMNDFMSLGIHRLWK